MKELQFYFDLSSPFAYLAATQVERVASARDARVSYRPFLLGGLFKAIGTPGVPLFSASEQKKKHYFADMTRWADHWGVPFQFPTRFPMNTVKALRLVLAAPEERWPQLLMPLFESYWAHDGDLADDATLVEVATKAGFDGAALLRATSDDAVKAALRERTEEAVRRGVFGAPTFFVDDMLFWGQDRFELVDKALGGWRSRADAAIGG